MFSTGKTVFDGDRLGSQIFLAHGIAMFQTSMHYRCF